MMNLYNHLNRPNFWRRPSLRTRYRGGGLAKDNCYLENNKNAIIKHSPYIPRIKKQILERMHLSLLNRFLWVENFRFYKINLIIIYYTM